MFPYIFIPNMGLHQGTKQHLLVCTFINDPHVLTAHQSYSALEHHLGMQTHNKTLSRIIRGNLEIDSKLDDPPDIEPIADKIVKSSLLGQDPWGDKELPSKTSQKGEEDAEASSEYSAEQALLKSIDNVWSYLSTHLRRILHEVPRHSSSRSG